MTNSITEMLNQNNQQPVPNLDGIKKMMQAVKFAQNPNLALQQMIQNNPQISEVCNIVSQSGMSPEQLFYALAKKKGVDPNQILAALQS